MSSRGYCWKCLRKDPSHQCMTDNLVEGRHLCVFCEDGVACPNDKRGITEMPKAAGYAAPAKLTHTADVVKDVEKSQAPAPSTSLESENLMEPKAPRTCSCGCGTPVRGRWPYIKGHGGAALEKSRIARGKAPAKAPRTSKASAPPAKSLPNSNGHAVATITVREEHLDRLFLALPLERKAKLISFDLASEAEG